MCYSIEGFREILKRKFPLESLNLSPIIIINREEKGEKAGEFLKSSLPDATFMKVAKTRISSPSSPCLLAADLSSRLTSCIPKQLVIDSFECVKERRQIN